VELVYFEAESGGGCCVMLVLCCVDSLEQAKVSASLLGKEEAEFLWECNPGLCLSRLFLSRGSVGKTPMESHGTG
jgi:hypothetical protein